MSYLSNPSLADVFFSPFTFLQLLRYRAETLSNSVNSRVVRNAYLLQNCSNYEKKNVWKICSHDYENLGADKRSIVLFV